MTWTLSGFGDEIDKDPVVQLSVLRALGAGFIEVRSAWGTNVVELTDDQLTELARLISERGMGVSAIASPLGKVDYQSSFDAELHRLSRAIAAAHAFGSRYIRIFSFYRPAGVTPAAIRDEVLRRLSAMASIAEREDIGRGRPSRSRSAGSARRRGRCGAASSAGGRETDLRRPRSRTPRPTARRP